MSQVGIFGMLSTKDKGQVQDVTSRVSDDPGNWDHKNQCFTAVGKKELAKALNNDAKKSNMPCL